MCESNINAAPYWKGSQPCTTENELDLQTPLGLARNKSWTLDGWQTMMGSPSLSPCWCDLLESRWWQVFQGTFPNVVLVPSRSPVDCRSPGSCSRRSMRSSCLFSIRVSSLPLLSFRGRFFHRALVFQWLLTLRFLIHFLCAVDNRKNR